MPRIDTDKLTPEERLDLIKTLEEDRKAYQTENLMDLKKEFEAQAKKKGFTLAQIFFAGVKRRTGPRGPRKPKDGT